MEFGLFWTAAGLLLVLLFIIGSRLLGWWRLWRAKSVARKNVPASPEQVVHEDDASLTALIAEANSALSKAPAYSDTHAGTPLSRLPLYLMIGPEASGKTSTFTNSGLEPQLLAGEVKGRMPLAATRLCNIWLAKNAVFVEIAGRAFSGDLSRWTQLLRVLRGQAASPGWRRFWTSPAPQVALSGVVAFFDIKNLMGTGNAESLTRQSRDWQERLGSIGEVFGVEFPVYQVITKCDAVSFFDDYFRRLPEAEANQVFGCTLPAKDPNGSQPAQVFAEAETKRLSRSFNPLFQALAQRRVTHLAHEPDPKRRPGVYEFPREFKRIKSPLVQLLTDAFRPHPLRPGPLLRGYYLTGMREVEPVAADLGVTRADWSAVEVAADATRLFRGDATQIFRLDDSNLKDRGGAGLVPRWMFSQDLFHTIILKDQPARRVVPVDSRLELYRRGALGALWALCGLLCFAWIWSWNENRNLLHEVGQVVEADVQKRGKLPLLADLQSLDALQGQVKRLSEYDRNRPPLPLRWGLYSGDRVAAPLKSAYFRRFQQLILNSLNGVLIASLEAVPSNPPPNAPYQPIYAELKGHLMISSGACKPEPSFAAQILKQTSDRAGLATTAESKALVDRQIEFYAKELAYGNPCRLTENTAVRDHARAYLTKVRGVETIYKNVMARAEHTLPAPLRLGAIAPNYTQVLTGPAEVSGAFSRDGWKFIERASKEGNAGVLGESCVVGSPSGVVGEWKQDAELAGAIQRLFIRDYIEHWRHFVTGFSVVKYRSPEDAARKLEIMADHKSPLLGLLALTANQTNFPAERANSKTLDKLTPLINKVIPGLGKAEKTVDRMTDAAMGPPEMFSSPTDITRVFQPVHWVVPPSSDTWVIDKNSAYIEALAQLGHSMQEIARSGVDPTIHQAAAQNREKALDAVRQIARGFKPTQVGGLDASVQHLLEDPIRFTAPFIIKDFENAAAGKVNQELRTLCTQFKSTLHKYPFQPSRDDVSLQELSAWFAPSTGKIWKFQAQSMADFVFKEGSQWKSKDPAKKPQVTPDMLSFLKHAQELTDAFFPPGAAQPQLTYTLRPKLDSSFGEMTLELEVDGRVHQWTSSLQKQFIWPAPQGSKDVGAVVRIKAGALTFPVASQGGTWGIFRIIRDAEPRPLLSKLVEWKKVRGGDGRLEPIQPAPVRMEIVEFPGGVDVFNPKFFEGLHCPSKAVE